MTSLALALLLLGPARASGQGAAVTTLSPGRQGAARVAVDVRDASLRAELGASPDPSAFNVVVGRGRARVVTAASGAYQPVRTVLAFDRSASFTPVLAEAAALAERLTAALPGDGLHATDVVTFGRELTVVGSATDPADLEPLLDAVARDPERHPVTRLKSLVDECVQLAATGQPLDKGGLRQVVVFTDAGDESSAYRVEELVASARSRGVVVHVVLFPPARGAGMAQALDEMRRLAEETGGFAVTATDPAAGDRLADIATAGSRAVWLDLAFCEVPPAPVLAADTLEVEILGGGQRRAWTGRVPFDQDGLGAAAAPCAGTTPAAATEGAAETAASSPLPIALGAALLASGALGAGLLVLRRRRPAPSPPAQPPGPPPGPERSGATWLTATPPAAPTRPASHPPPELLPVTATRPRSVPPPEPVPDVLSTATTGNVLPQADEVTDEFDIRNLPETRLVVTQAPPGIRLVPWYRLTLQTFFLGAGEADLVVDFPQVSGRHARLELFPSARLFLTDLDSTNGTFLNGRRLASGERVLVKRGDVIGLTRHVLFRVEQPGLSDDAAASADVVRQRERTLYSVPRNGDS